ncbi:MAG: alpha-1,2-fucosyltransferase [Crocinitomicaceae bacterium]|nr:alpha-1,2-fucosyltransferase [Crocinitomicaceae bacterium]
MLELAKNKNAIAVHVRRGDYFYEQKNLSTHGVCSKEYYQHAIEKFSDLDNILFVVLSDEPQWAKENLIFGASAIFVDWNKAEDSRQDMMIISTCQHAIIANSSFSWWGAKTHSKTHKNALLPAIWYANSEIQNQNPGPYSNVLD